MTKANQRPPVLSHTPGPWDYDMDFIVAPDPNGVHRDIYIAEITHADDEGRMASPEQQDANRRLVAAAPNLYEAAKAPKLDAAHDRLSELLENPDAGNDDIREAVVDLCTVLVEHHEARKAALLKATGNREPGIDIHRLLAARRQIAVIWSVEDVQSVRRDLSVDQAWQVLHRYERVQDCDTAHTWQVIEFVANQLFPTTDEGDGQ